MSNLKNNNAALEALIEQANALPVAITVDATLTQEGAAADAKATGDAIAAQGKALKDKLTAFSLNEMPGANMYHTTDANGNPVWEKKLAYKETVVTNVPETTVTTDEDGYANNPFEIQLHHGSTYTVTVDGVAYECVSNGLMLGDSVSVPFSISSFGGNVDMNFNESGTHIVAITGLNEVTRYIGSEWNHCVVGVCPELDLAAIGFGVPSFGVIDPNLGASSIEILDAIENGRPVVIYGYMGDTGITSLFFCSGVEEGSPPVFIGVMHLPENFVVIASLYLLHCSEVDMPGNEYVLFNADLFSGDLRINQLAAGYFSAQSGGAVFSEGWAMPPSEQYPNTAMLRNTKLVTTETNPTNNGEIFWTYE